MGEEKLIYHNNRGFEIPIRKKDGFAIWAAIDIPFQKDNKEGEQRSLFKHDGDEIIYSAAFRRLSDKSQVVVKPETSDHFRSRLTHTLEVNQIAESIGAELKLNTLLINAIALGHDIGHTPFGHAGERQFQQIMRIDLLPLCDSDELNEKLGIRFKPTGECENKHWLFHHALNSKRIIQRKFNGISQETMDGILKHSWSPWQVKTKFDTPVTYEGQVVAIADQIAGINHDTEDIITCREALCPIKRIRNELPHFMVANKIMDHHTTKEFLEQWFLPKKADSREKGYGRKYRLRHIINDVVDTSYKLLIEKKVDSSVLAKNIPIVLSESSMDFLRGYEKYIREEIIGKGSWFKLRDALAETSISTVYNFFKHYTLPIAKIEEVTPLNIPPKVQEDIRIAVTDYKNSISTDNYGEDTLARVFVESAKEKSKEAEDIIRTIDYVSGMTDGFLMNFYAMAFNLFK